MFRQVLREIALKCLRRVAEADEVGCAYETAHNDVGNGAGRAVNREVIAGSERGSTIPSRMYAGSPMESQIVKSVRVGTAEIEQAARRIAENADQWSGKIRGYPPPRCSNA